MVKRIKEKGSRVIELPLVCYLLLFKKISVRCQT